MQNDEKECPFCAEVIKNKAIVCRYCGRDLTSTNSDKTTGAQPVSIEKVPCKKCGGLILLSTAQKTDGHCMRCASWKIKIRTKTKPECTSTRVKNVRCPSCGKAAVHRITAGSKIAAGAVFGFFAIGHISKTFKCSSCGYKW